MKTILAISLALLSFGLGAQAAPAAKSSIAEINNVRAAISEALEAGRIDARTAAELDQSLFENAATPGDVARFLAWLGRTAVSEGWKLSWNTAKCIVDLLADTGKLAACNVVGMTRGASALEACWKEILSPETKANCGISE